LDATRSPELSDKLPKDVAAIEALRDGAVAFNLLLKPLFEESASAPEVVILIDALDEGDPPEQLQMQQMIDLEGQDAIEVAKVVCVKACGNEVLALVVGLLPTLPPNVRFIFTSRPDAVCNGIRSTLNRAFASSVTFIDSPEELRKEIVKPATSTDPTTTSSKVMLCETVIKECKLEHLVRPSASYTNLIDLYSLYVLVFDDSKSGVGEGDAPFMCLLNVIMAAQEPLSHAMLHDMGLACQLEHLPGWGCLFYEADHHIYLYHKSLSDWLHLGKETNPRHSVQDSVSQGHALLGEHLIKPILISPPSDSLHAALPLVLPHYTSQYVFLHLAKAKSQPCSLLVDAALARWDLMKAVFRAGQGGRVVIALAGMDVRTPYAEDSLRVLRRCFNEFEKGPEDMERVTYANCPTQSLKYAEAVSRMHYQPTIKLLGGVNGWGAAEAVLLVSLKRCPCHSLWQSSG
jgi:hypothetical protein